MTKKDKKPKPSDAIAVLIDGDNLSRDFADQIRRIAGEHGRPDIMRVYANAARSLGWDDVPGFRVVHAGRGKNAADLLMCIEGMELALRDGLRRFVLCSSDGDFSHLAHRLREMGCLVLGMGEAKCPPALQEACSKFIDLEREGGARDDSAQAAASPDSATKIDRQIRGVIEQYGERGKGLKIKDLGQKMYAKHKVRISTLKDRSWRGYLSHRPKMYELDPRGSEACVRVRPDGFKRDAA